MPSLIFEGTFVVPIITSIAIACTSFSAAAAQSSSSNAPASSSTPSSSSTPASNSAPASSSTPVSPQSLSVSSQSAASQKISRLSPSARQLAEQLKLVEPIDQLITKQADYEQSKTPQSLVEAMAARQKLLMNLQHAALEVEEALTGIDGDLTINNMLLT